MNRVLVSSLQIKSVGYEPSTGVMEIEFRGGRIYQYPNTTPKEYDDLLAAPSVGKHFHQHVRPKNSHIG